MATCRRGAFQHQHSGHPHHALWGWFAGSIGWDLPVRRDVRAHKHNSRVPVDGFQSGSSVPVATPPTLLGVMARAQQPVTLVVKQASSAPICTISDATAPATQGCVDFTTVAVGGTATQSLTVINMGDVPLATGDALVTAETAGSPAGTATFTDDGGCAGHVLQAYDWAGTGSGTDRCVTVVTVTGGALALRASATVPAATSFFEVGTTTATTGAATARYVLGADVRKAAALTITAVTPATNTFPNTAVTGYVDQNFTIVNGTNATDFQTSGVVAVGITGTNASQFQLVGTTCPPNIGLKSGEGCQATIRFAPTALSPDGNAFTASLNATATPGTAPAVTILGMPKSALTITPNTGTAAAPTFTIPVGATASQQFTVTLDSTAVPTAALDTSITGANFMLIDDECYGKILTDSNPNCLMMLKYIAPGTATAVSTTLTVNGGTPGQSVSIVVSYTGTAATTH